jgi:hypothetical protein
MKIVEYLPQSYVIINNQDKKNTKHIVELKKLPWTPYIVVRENSGF